MAGLEHSTQEDLILSLATGTGDNGASGKRELVEEIPEKRIGLADVHHAWLAHPLLLHHHAAVHSPLAASALHDTPATLHDLAAGLLWLLLHALHDLLLLRLETHHAPAPRLLLLEDLS
jgi:hypothetical protein